MNCEQKNKMHKALLRHVSKILVALLLASYFVAPKAAEHHMSWEFKAIGAGLLAAGIIHTAGHCKYGVVDSTETDTVTGISKPAKVCASAPNSEGGYSDYTDKQLAEITIANAELDKNMKEAGEPKKDGCARHRIVPKAHKLIDENKDSRKMLEDCIININDAINGVDLPYRSDADCEGTSHIDLHSKKYYRAIYYALLKAKNSNGCEGIKSTLKELKQNLKSGILGKNGYE